MSVCCTSTFIDTVYTFVLFPTCPYGQVATDLQYNWLGLQLVRWLLVQISSILKGQKHLYDPLKPHHSDHSGFEKESFSPETLRGTLWRATFVDPLTM